MGVRLFTRNGYRFHGALPEDSPTRSRACRCDRALVDGESIVVDERGLSVFDALHYRLRDLWMASRKPALGRPQAAQRKVNLERKRSEILGLAWPERKAFVPAKPKHWHTAAPVVSQSSAGAAK